MISTTIPQPFSFNSIILNTYTFLGLSVLYHVKDKIVTKTFSAVNYFMSSRNVAIQFISFRSVML